MPLRNGAHGYGAVTKALHWVTVLAVATQFVIGYTMEADDGGHGRGRGRGRGGDDDGSGRGRGRGRGGDDEDEGLGVLDGGFDLLDLHVVLGLTILALAVTRVVWRATTPLPPWDDRLTPANQRVVHATEVALLTLLFVVPLTGLALVVGEDDLLPLHVAAHVAFFVALAAHLAMVLGRRLLPRML
ncbi:cytochrome b/b6 domain-containing protein [Nocardioides sp. YIM 152315]|uniref:cytochrome b n=1 Tax=Nocardioides sp. YIM 152315 TaxID=3031760 RepID=UPI0023DA177C|nr:cytochrome b/b6 domain-containing protein [Nocardioides sp. YIM 152315]MDF1602563.1 cytochrome b/b6 domain-containing protein [Nocardioides sp. YIM 152315]